MFTIKNHIKSFYSKIIILLKILKYIFIINRFLENGLYVIKDDKLVKYKSLSKRKGCLFPFIIVFSWKKNKMYSKSLNDSVQFIFKNKPEFGGGKKDIFLFDKVVLSFYYGINVANLFNNMKTYLCKNNYDRCVYFEFNIKKRFVLCEKVLGTPLNYDDVLCCAKHILELNRDSSIFLNFVYDERILNQFKFFGIVDVLSCVQHGDLTKYNIYKNNEKFKVIDFDTIGVYPLLYDFFRLLSDIKNGFEKFYYGYFDDMIKKLIGINNLDELEKDKYLACFFIVNNGWANRINFANIPSNYFKTKSVLGEIYK